MGAISPYRNQKLSRQPLVGFWRRFLYNIIIRTGQYGISFRNFLEHKNILNYFTYKEIQDDYKITKPDTRYFEAILKNCACKAEESIMIGDRIDKDIIPAKLVGMKTIRVKTGIHKGQESRTPDEIADLTVNKLCGIRIEAINSGCEMEDKWE